MNLNIHFDITSEKDAVLDSNAQAAAVLLQDEPVAEKAELNLARLKEFYPDCWESPQEKVEGEEPAPKKKKNLNLLQSAIPLPQLDPELE